MMTKSVKPIVVYLFFFLSLLFGLTFLLFNVDKISIGVVGQREGIPQYDDDVDKKHQLYTTSISSHHRVSDKCSTNTAGDFDFYVLSMSYQPEFCFQSLNKSYVGCEHPNDFWRGSLTMHGLWPQYKDGYPCTCSNEQFNQQTITDLGQNLFDSLWPNVKASFTDQDYTGFWQHEWSKHGTCSGLVQNSYFRTAFEGFLPTPTIVRSNYGSNVNKTDLLNAYNNDAVLVCVGSRFHHQKRKYLSEVRICLRKNPIDDEEFVLQQFKCPPSVTNEGNCMDTISISKFYIDDFGEVEENATREKM